MHRARKYIQSPHTILEEFQLVLNHLASFLSMYFDLKEKSFIQRCITHTLKQFHTIDHYDNLWNFVGFNNISTIWHFTSLPAITFLFLHDNRLTPFLMSDLFYCLLNKGLILKCYQQFNPCKAKG